jgi:hypothetical protein
MLQSPFKQVLSAECRSFWLTPIMKNLIFCVSLITLLTACGASAKQDPTKPPTTPPLVTEPPVTIPTPVAPPAAAAPPFLNTPVALPTYLTLVQSASTPLTVPQLISFNNFIQSQESPSHFQPTRYLFEFAKDETPLSVNQASLLRNMRDTALCTTQNDFTNTQVDQLVPGLVTTLTLNQGLQGTRCNVQYTTSSRMQLKYESINNDTGEITYDGPVSSSDQIVAKNNFAKGEIGGARYSTGMSGNVFMISNRSTQKLRRKAKMRTEVTGSNGQTYTLEIDADVLILHTWGGSDNAQLATNIKLSSSQLLAPVVFSMLTSTDSLNGVPTASNTSGYLNLTAQNATQVAALLNSNFYKSAIGIIGSFEAPLVWTGN